MPPIQPAWLAVNPQSSVISGITAANVAIGARLAINPNVSTAIVAPLPVRRRIRARPQPPNHAERIRIRTRPDTGSLRAAGNTEGGLNRTTQPHDGDKSEQTGRPCEE